MFKFSTILAFDNVQIENSLAEIHFEMWFVLWRLECCLISQLVNVFRFDLVNFEESLINKSRGFKSGDLGGHSITPLRPNKLSGKISSSKFRIRRE